MVWQALKKESPVNIVREELTFVLNMVLISKVGRKNTEHTRRQVIKDIEVNLRYIVKPEKRKLLGNYKVVCDETNNFIKNKSEELCVEIFYVVLGLDYRVGRYVNLNTGHLYYLE